MINAQKARTFLTGAFLLFVSMAVFVPFYPIFPTAGLDHSWVFTMNEAVAQRWIFGKEIIFTFGPYASIFSKAYHPATDSLIFFSSLFFAFCYGILLFLLAKSTKLLWIAAYALYILGCICTSDPLLLTYPLILFFVIYRFSLNEIHLSQRACLALPLFFSPLGLLPLIKGSFLPICGGVAIISFFLLWQSKKKALAYFSFLIPLIAGPLFWVIAGQSLSALPLYFLSMSSIIAGYTEAMSIPGYSHEIIVYILASGLILWSVFQVKCESLIHKVCLPLTLTLFLFIVFKAGFIRHDAHAALVSGPFLVMVILLLNTIKVEEKFLRIPVIMAIAAWICIDAHEIKTSTRSFLENIINRSTNIKKGLQLRLSSQNTFKTIFLECLNDIQTKVPIPKLIGSSDIYSFQQSYLLSSENQFSFRPVFQSYSAYTPELAQCNEDYLHSKKAPDNIFFSIETIDGRLPSLDDGLSWPTLINNYTAERCENNFLLLKKKPNKTNLTELEIYRHTNQIGEQVYLPNSENLLYATIEISQTILGKIRSFFFKPTELYITIYFFDDKCSTYRIISTMTKSRFLLSPLVENTSDFLYLCNSQLGNFTNKIVKSIQINGNTFYWNKNYKLRFSTIEHKD